MKQLLYGLLLCMLLVFAGWIADAQDISQVANQKPVVINGTFGFGIGTYTASGIENRERNFSYLISGSPVLTLYGISFPFSVVVSDQQRGFRQPFNQYGISPQYKWLTLHIGWQSITWSPFTMAGYNFLGGGVEANPGKLRMGFVYGRFNKAINAATTGALDFETPAYKRTGYAARLGYGSEANHLDLTFLNARDDPKSIDNPLLLSDLHPAGNIVLGLGGKFAIRKHFVFDFDVAASLYTRDRLNDTLQDLQFEHADFIKSLIILNLSTQFLTAAQSGLSYQNSSYHVGLQYKRVDPDFKSMGAYYFETDVANYTIQGGINLFKNAMQLNGSIGLQNDNLLNDKPYTSHRNISSLSVSYNKPAFGADLRFANYGITQDRGLNPVVDTFRVARTNYNINAMVRYTKSDSLVSQNIILACNMQSLVDLNHFTSGQDQTNSKTLNLSYQLGFNKSMFSFNTNFNYTVADIIMMHTIFFGPSFGISKQLDKNKLMLNAAFAYQLQHNNGENSGSIINGSLNGSYRLGKREGINLSVSYLKSDSKDITLPSFDEVRSSLTFTHTF